MYAAEALRLYVRLCSLYSYVFFYFWIVIHDSAPHPNPPHPPIRMMANTMLCKRTTYVALEQKNKSSNYIAAAAGNTLIHKAFATCYDVNMA